MSLKGAAISGVRWTSLSTVVLSGLQLAQLAVLAHLLRPADFGLMAMAMVVTGFAQAYADMGVGAAIVQRQEITSGELSSLYWLTVVGGVAVSSLVCAASPMAVTFFGEPVLREVLPWVALSLLFTAVSQQYYWLLEKDLRFDVLAVQEIFAGIVSAVVAVSLAFLDKGVWSLVLGQLAGSALKSLLLLRVGLPRWRPAFHCRWTDLEGYWAFGLYQMAERSVNYFNSRVDQLLVGKLLGAQELGYYTFAFNLVTQPSSLVNPVLTRVAFPVFSRIQRDSLGLQQSYVKMTRLLCTVNAPLLFGLGAVATPLVSSVFGRQWEPAALLVQILAVYGFLRSIINPVGTLLLAKGRADLGFRWNFAIFFTTAPVIFLGSKLGGASGVASALLVAQAVYVFANYQFLVKPLVGACGRHYAVSIGKPAIMAASMAAFVVSVSFVAGPSHGWLPAEIGLGVAVYLTLLWMLDRPLLLELRGVLSGASS